MHTEIAGLLNRIEAAKQLLVLHNLFFDYFSSNDGLSNFPSSDFPASTSCIGGECSTNPSKKDLVGSLGSFVRIKEAEAQMFQRRADDTRGEADSLRRLAWLKSRRLEEEYSEKTSKLRLPEIEERRKKKAEELKALENSLSDCNEVKTRMHMEFSAMLSRMDAAKKPPAAMACQSFLLLLFLQQPSTIELVVFGNMQLLIFLHLPPFLANLPLRSSLRWEIFRTKSSSFIKVFSSHSFAQDMNTSLTKPNICKA